MSLPQRSAGYKAIDHIINFNRSPEIFVNSVHKHYCPAGTEASIFIRVSDFCSKCQYFEFAKFKFPVFTIAFTKALSNAN